MIVKVKFIGDLEADWYSSCLTVGKVYDAEYEDESELGYLITDDDGCENVFPYEIFERLDMKYFQLKYSFYTNQKGGVICLIVTMIMNVPVYSVNIR